MIAIVLPEMDSGLGCVGLEPQLAEI